jgi:hypothetical protein
MATEKTSLEVEVKPKGINKTEKELDKLAKTTEKVGKKQTKTKKTSSALEKQLKALKAEVKALKNEQKAGLNTGERANRHAGDLGQKSGLAAIQVEQLVGQIAGGQNPMRAFGQQSADIGFVLGQPMLGAILGVSAALTSLLIPMLFETKVSLEELESIAGELGDTFAIDAKTGAMELTSSLQTLGKTSGSLAELQIALRQLQADMALQDAATELQKTISKMTIPFTSTVEQMKNARIGLGTVFEGVMKQSEKLGKKLGLTGDQIFNLSLAFREVKKETDGAEEAFEKLFIETLKSTQGDKDLVKLADSYLRVSQAIQTFKGVTEGNFEGESAVDNKEAFDRRINQLKVENALLNDKQDLALQLSTTFNATQRKEIINQQKINDELRETNRLKDTSKKTVEALIQSTMSETDKILALHEKREKAINLMEIKTEADRRLRSKLHVLNEQETNKALAEVADKAAKVETDNIARVMREKKAAQKASIALAQEALEQERLLFAENLTETQLYWTHWLETAQTTMNTFNGLGETMVNSFQSSFATAIESAIFDSKSATQALQGMFEGIGRAFVRYTAQMIAQQMAVMAVNKILGASMGDPMKKQFEKQKQFAKNQVYAAGINAYVQQLASLNSPANALKAMVLSMGLTGSLASQMKGGGGGIGGLLSSSAGSGGSGGGGGGGGGMMSKSGRALGGQVRGGESYLVGERGPELLTMPSNRMGRITPNSSMGGGQLNVTVENYGSSNISVQKISETDVRIIAREVATQTVQREAPRVIASDISNPNGRVSKTLANNTNTQRRR